MWNIWLLLMILYLITGLIDHLINIFRFFFSKESNNECCKKHKLEENK